MSSPSHPVIAAHTLEANFGRETNDAAVLELEAERIARQLKLPPCPSILAAFYREMNDDDADIRKLADLVNADLALSAAVLKTVNSPGYGLAKPTGNIQQALSIIGLRPAANMLSRLLLRQVFPASQGMLMKTYWQDNAALVEVAHDTARQFFGANTDEAITYLVFRDCGVAVMINQYDDYVSAYQLHRSGHAYEGLQTELMRYQTSYPHVGYAIAREWRLPETLMTAILCHHDVARPATTPRQLRGMPVRLAAFGLLMDQIVSCRSGGGVTADWEMVEPFVLDELKLTPEQVVKLIAMSTVH
jgi:HD-like signal output (HDOD) protein